MIHLKWEISSWGTVAHGECERATRESRLDPETIVSLCLEICLLDTIVPLHPGRLAPDKSDLQSGHAPEFLLDEAKLFLVWVRKFRICIYEP